MRLLVTGAGRTGTWWLTHALRNCGIDAEHEQAFSISNHGEGDWTCEVSWLAAPYTEDLDDDIHVVHLVRDPRAAIASRVGWGSFETVDPSGNYDPRIKGLWATSWVPEIMDGASPVERAARHWVAWNDFVRSHEILRIEDVDAVEILRLAMIVDPEAELGAIPAKNVNQSKDKPIVAWSDVEQVPGLIDQAKEWRYL